MTTLNRQNFEDEGSMNKNTMTKTNQKTITVTNKVIKPVGISSSIRYGTIINGNTIIKNEDNLVGDKNE